uniref:Beta-glucosidase n=1 Tax=Salix viminalis TaxID=40686 RepID=A0A6N2N1G1_SALVM
MGNIDDFSRYSFPDDFVFGTSSSAYQYEGETNKHGRGPAIWDTFTEEHTGRCAKNERNGNAFRFSISWSRVIPHGRISAGVNEEGIKFYNDLIDDLLENGLQPYVTLFHWDTPQALEDKYGGFLSPNIVNDFRDFVDLCFKNFGDRVKKWITLNEPWTFNVQGYDLAQCTVEFLSLFMDPLTNGDYPRNMHDFVGGRLPKFTTEESEMVKGSYDFIGINYYTTYYAQNIDADYQSVGYMSDARTTWTGERNGIPIGPQAGVKWLYIYPEGICKLLNYTKDHYRSPPIYITENGVDDVNSSASSLKEALDDPVREKSYKDHLKNVLRSINEHGVDVKGFFAWSLLDNFEWGNGYTVRFGLYYVDYTNNLKRYPKNSVKWFKQFLRRDDSHSPVPHALPLGDEKSKIEDGLARDAKRPRNA